MNRGAGGWKVILVIAILVGIGFGTAKFAPPYLNMLCLKNKMEEYLRKFALMGEEEMINSIIKVGRQDCKLPKLRYENFSLSEYLEVGEVGTIRCEYTEVIHLWGSKFYKWKMKPEVTIKIPEARI